MTKSEAISAAILRTIRAIPYGKVATYGQVAEAAGYLATIGKWRRF